MKKILVIICLLGAMYFPSVAQESDNDSSSLGEVLQTFFSKDGPNLGFLGQFDAEVRDNGNESYSSFNVHLLRLYVYGGYGEKFLYFLQGNLVNGFDLLDIKFSYKLSDEWGIDAGQFKAPFGGEYLRNDGKLLFVNRSLAAQTVGPLRQKGVQVHGLLFDRYVSLTGGIFNGGNGNRISLFSGKIGVTILRKSNTSDVELQCSSSMAYSDDLNDLPGLDYFAEVKKLYSSDIRFGVNDTWLEAEYDVFEHSRFLWKGGYRVDVAHRFGSEWEGALRMEWFRSDTRYSMLDVINYQTITRKYILGVNWYPLQPVKLQLNLEREHNTKTNGVYLNLQYAINYEH